MNHHRLAHLFFKAFIVAVAIWTPNIASRAENQGNFVLVVDRANGDASTAVHDELNGNSVLQGVIRYINMSFDLPARTVLHFRDCNATDDTGYAAGKHEILMCYREGVEAEALFEKFPDARPYSRELSTDTLLFIATHEIGHMLIDEYNLPYSGSQEDSADEIATLLTSGPHPELPSAAASWVLLKLVDDAQQSGKKEYSTNRVDYFDQHSYGFRRWSAIICLEFGANEQIFEDDVTQLGWTAVQKAKCRQEYQRKQKYWLAVLAPHTRSGVQL